MKKLQLKTKHPTLLTLVILLTVFSIIISLSAAALAPRNGSNVSASDDAVDNGQQHVTNQIKSVVAFQVEGTNAYQHRLANGPEQLADHQLDHYLAAHHRNARLITPAADGLYFNNKSSYKTVSELSAMAPPLI